MADVRVGGAYVDLYLKGMNQFNADTKKAQQELSQLTATMSKLTKQQQAASKVLADAESKFGKYSKEAKEARKTLNDLKSEYSDASRQAKALTQDLYSQATAMNQLSKSTLKNVKSNNIAEQLKNMSDSANLAKNSFNELKLAMDVLKTALVALGARSLYDFLIQPNAQFEQYIVQFTTLLGSVENAQVIMNDIIQVAKKTPFETPDVADAVEILSQYGVAQDELMEKFNQLADLSKGNAENLNAIALSYGRITNSSKVTLQQLNIMIRRGVPIMQAFADVTGKTTGELYKMIRNGELGIEVFKEAIDYLTKNGGRFEGLVEEQSKTLEGKISTLKDDITFIGKDIGEETFEKLSGYVSDMIAEIEKLEATGELKEITDGLGHSIATLVEGIANVSKLLYEFGEPIATIVGNLILFKTVLLAVHGAMKLISSINMASMFTGFNIALMAVSVALTAVVKGFMEVASAEERLAGATHDLEKELLNSVDLYNKEIDTVNAYADRASKLSEELKKLMEQESRTSTERERVLEIITELNRIYPELNMQYNSERDELSKNISTLDEYIDAQKRLAEVKASSSLLEDIERQKMEQEIEAKNLIQQKKELEERKASIENEISNRGGWNWIPITEWYGYKKQLDDVNSEIRITEQAFLDLAKANEVTEQSEQLLIERNKELYDEIKKAGEVVLDEVSTFDTINNLLNDLDKSIGSAFEALEGSSDFKSGIDSAVSAIDNLTDAMVKNSEEASFNLDETMNLIMQYPELANAMYATADGYKFESSALEELRNLKIKAAYDAVNIKYHEMKETLYAIDMQIDAYRREGNAIDELMVKRRAALESISTYKGELDAYYKLINLASSNTGRSTTKKASTASTPKRTSSKATETADAKAIRNLKFQYDMGIIDAKNYYDSLEKIKNKYYKNGTKEWQQYTLEIKRGREKIQEEQKKAAESEFKNTISGMEELIEDAEFYGTASKEEIVKKYQDIRKYILNAYLDRKIDYENFAEQLRKIDKDIYSAQKDMLKENLDNMSLLRSDAYEKAVKQINDYYESIKKARKNAERDEELAELKETEALYQGAVSRAGQNKLKELQKDIRKLEREKMQDELENQREYHLENLEAKYKALEENQNEYFSTVQNGVKTTAEVVAEYTRQINEFFAQVNQVMQTQRAINEPIVNSLTLNQNITDASSNRAAIDISKIIYNYGFK